MGKICGAQEEVEFIRVTTATMNEDLSVDLVLVIERLACVTVHRVRQQVEFLICLDLSTYYLFLRYNVVSVQLKLFWMSIFFLQRIAGGEQKYKQLEIVSMIFLATWFGGIFYREPKQVLPGSA